MKPKQFMQKKITVHQTVSDNSSLIKDS